jgi:hypothetical protein
MPASAPLKSPELKPLQENHLPTLNALQRKLPHGRPCQSSHSKHSRVGSSAQPKGDAPRMPVYAHPCCGRPKTEFLISSGEPPKSSPRRIFRTARRSRRSVHTHGSPWPPRIQPSKAIESDDRRGLIDRKVSGLRRRPTAIPSNCEAVFEEADTTTSLKAATSFNWSKPLKNRNDSSTKQRHRRPVQRGSSTSASRSRLQ